MSWHGHQIDTINAIRAMEYVDLRGLEILTGFSGRQITKWRKAGLLSHIEGKTIRFRLATVLAEIAALQVKCAETPKAGGAA